MHRQLLPVVAVCVGVLLCAGVGHALAVVRLHDQRPLVLRQRGADRTGGTKHVITPVVGARVEFYHSVAGWTGPVRFDAAGAGGAHRWDGRLPSATIHASDATNYYARLVLNDDNSPEGSVHLENWWTGTNKSYQAPFADSSRGSTSYDVLIKGSSGNPPLCAIWQGAHNAYQEYVGSVARFRPPPSTTSPSRTRRR